MRMLISSASHFQFRPRHCAVLAILAANVGSQTIQITGRVVERINLDPVPGATVRWNGGNPQTLTDSLGRFTLSQAVAVGGGSLNFAAPSFHAGRLRVATTEPNQVVTVSMYTAEGKRKGAHRFAFSQPGIQELAVFPENQGDFFGFMTVKCQGLTFRFKVLHQDGPVTYTRADFVSTPTSPLARAAAGTVNASITGLNPGTANATSDTMNVGDIILDYPARGTIGVGATPPYGSTMLFDGSQGRAAGNNEMQTKWQDWPRFTPSAIMFRITRDPQFLTDTNRVTLQSCCNTLWGYDDIQAKVGIFQDVQVHAEFNTLGEYDNPYDLPAPNANVTDPYASGQPGYANSGVYVASRYEIQIQSFALTGPPGNHDMGAIVNDYVPTSNQNRANGVWQAYDATYRGGRFNGATMTTQPYMSVWWNGVQTHLNRAINAASSGLANHSGEEHLDPTLYGLKLQSEGRDVRFRKVWVKKLTLATTNTNLGY